MHGSSELWLKRLRTVNPVFLSIWAFFSTTFRCTWRHERGLLRRHPRRYRGRRLWSTRLSLPSPPFHCSSARSSSDSALFDASCLLFRKDVECPRGTPHCDSRSWPQRGLLVTDSGPIRVPCRLSALVIPDRQFVTESGSHKPSVWPKMQGTGHLLPVVALPRGHNASLYSNMISRSVGHSSWRSPQTYLTDMSIKRANHIPNPNSNCKLMSIARLLTFKH